MISEIAVIMSVYKNDRMEWFKESVDAILNQSFNAIDIYLFVDGLVCNDITELINHYSKLPNFHVNYSENNVGLAQAMNTLIKSNSLAKKYPYIARMDSDDICHEDRFKEQYDFMEKNSNISVLGTDCIEIDESGLELNYKKMPSSHCELDDLVIKRCPFNHPTVIMRSEVFINGFFYNDKLRNTQDYFFWIELLKNGYKFANLNKPLLFFRITADFYKKRGRGKAYNDFKGRLYAIKLLNRNNIRNYFYAFSISILRLSPVWFSKFIYKYMRQ